MFTFIGVLLLFIALANYIWGRVKAAYDEADAEKLEYNKTTTFPKELTNMIKFPIPGKKRIILTIGIALIALNGFFFWAQPGTAYSVQYPWGGDKMIATQGLKIKAWGRTIPLSYETSIRDVILKQTAVNGEWIIPSLSDNDMGIYNRKAQKWEFSDAIKADIACAVIVGVSIDDEDKFLRMADRNRSEAKLINGRVLPNIDAALKNTCKLMDAQEYISGKASDFDRYFKDQLENGMYLVEEYTPQNQVQQIIGDTSTVRLVGIGDQNEQKKYRIKRDSQGNIMRDETSNSLKQYGLSIIQAKVTSIDWEDSFDERLDKQKNEVALTQLEKQEAERQYFTTKKEIAKGEAMKAKERATLEKAQISLTIAAETEAKVAEQNVIVERRQLEVEKLKAQSKKVAADATYYENAKRVQAGLTPQERAELELAIAVGVARELKELKLPTTFIQGSSNGKNSSGLLETLIGAELAKNMMPKSK